MVVVVGQCPFVHAIAVGSIVNWGNLNSNAKYVLLK